MADVEVKINSRRVNLMLEKMPPNVRAAVVDTVIKQGGTIADLARSRAEQLLQVHTGKFVSRIRFRLRARGNRVTGRVYSTHPAAAILEFGGTTKPHQIVPRKARALLIGNDHFAARVQHPGGHYQGRMIILGAFDQSKEALAAALEAAVDNAVTQ